MGGATSLLNGKKIAILGGMGVRGESRDALIIELGLAELTWIYSERNKVKEYAIFCEAIKPGKYDYIFILTKFLSHKVWEHIKKADIKDIPLIRINGSYNAEGFLRALQEQTAIGEEVKPNEAIQRPAIIKKVLTPAEADISEANIGVPQTEPIDSNAIADKINRPKESRLYDKITALEAKIKVLEANQQDMVLLKTATQFYNAFIDLADGFPIPADLKESKSALLGSLKVHGMNVKEASTPRAEPGEIDVMMSNIVLSKLFTSLGVTMRFFSEEKVTDRHGACIACKRHKSVGCHRDCPHYTLKELYKFVQKGTQIAKSPTIMDTAKFLVQRIGEAM
jgi:hypothetical protein